MYSNKSIKNSLADIDEIFCQCLSGFLDGLDSQFDTVSPIRGGAKTGILRYTLEMFVYKWLLLVIG